MKPVKSISLAAVNPSDSTSHYTDHLAPLASFLNIPLLLSDEQGFLEIEKYYPGVEIQHIPYDQYTIDYLIERFDGVITSDLWGKKAFHEKYGPTEKKYNKHFSVIHCPHGFSDKGFYLHKVVHEEINLIYGQNFLDLLKSWDVLSLLGPYTFLGNYRYTYYKKYKSFFDDLVFKEVFSKFEKRQTTVLYAPTWKDEKSSTSFFSYGEKILEDLPSDINLVVKLHPRLELDDAAHFYRILGKYEKKRNVLFLSNFPLVYPLLSYVDSFLGDISSIGYDFLTFNKPLFFVPQSLEGEKNIFHLLSAGIVLKEGEKVFDQVVKGLQKDEYEEKRAKLYNYTFAKDKTEEELKTNIFSLLSKNL